MLRQLLQLPEPAVAWELLELPDGGLVSLRWLVGPRGPRSGSGRGVPSSVLLLISNVARKVTGVLLQLGLWVVERGLRHHHLQAPGSQRLPPHHPCGRL